MPPIEAASRVTGEKDPLRFRVSHRFWRKAIRTVGEQAFREILDRVFGEFKAGEVENPGAILTNRLKAAITEVDCCHRAPAASARAEILSQVG